MKVTVIIPNYNHAPYLDQRIKSVLKQTYTNFELIILDDCSKDGSREIIEQYRNDPHLSCIIYNEFNSGSTFLQWERGIAFAKGEWIWIAESDDWCEPNFLETLVKGIKPDCNLAFCQSIVVDNNDAISVPTISENISGHINGEKFLKDRMLHGNSIVNASMCIFRRSSFLSISKEYTTYKFCGDWLVWILLSEQGNVFISGEYLNYFRKHKDDVSSSSYRNGLYYYEYIRMLDQLEERLITNEEKDSLLLAKYKELLQDVRVESEVKRKICTLFSALISVRSALHIKAFAFKQTLAKWKI